MTAAFSGVPAAVGAGRSLLGGAGSLGIDNVKYGVTMWFRVAVHDGVEATPLGEWSTCSGVKVEIGHEAVKDGINHTRPRIVPTALTYPQITLERAVSGPGSMRVQKWLEDVVGRWVQAGDGAAPGSSGFPGVTVRIDLYAAPQGPGGTSGVPVRTWTLRNAYPVAWEGPALDSDSGGVATEKLTLAHRGFLGDAPSSAGSGATGESGLLKLTAVKDDKELHLQYQPDSITMNKSLNFRTGENQSLAADPGMLNFGFTVRLDGATKVKEAKEQLFEWIERDVTKSGKAETDGVKVLVLRIGSSIEKKVWLRSVNTTFTRFSASGDPCRAEFVLSLEEHIPWKSAKPSAESRQPQRDANAASGITIGLRSGGSR